MTSNPPGRPADPPDSPQALLACVLAAMQDTPDARLRSLLSALTTQLHEFVREQAVTEAEFEAAVAFVVGIGQATGPTKNEVILAADLLGLSTLVALQNNPGDGAAAGASQAALLGPFWRADAPACAAGVSIARGQPAATAALPLEVAGTVFGADGQPLAQALVDVWQADPSGWYENQDEAQPEMNLRGRFRTDAAGRYRLRSVMPAGYPVPTDGPCGQLLRLQQRQPMRPAHLHFMVSDPGHRVLVTQVFPATDPHLVDDPVFGVTPALVAAFEHSQEDGQPLLRVRRDFHLARGDCVFPHPPIP